MLKNTVKPSQVGAAIGYGSAAGTLGFALGPLWGGSLFAASSAPGTFGFLGNGRLFFIVLATLAAANSQLAFSLPPWPEDKHTDWRYPLFRCASSSLQSLSSSGTLVC